MAVPTIMAAFTDPTLPAKRRHAGMQGAQTLGLTIKPLAGRHIADDMIRRLLQGLWFFWNQFDQSCNAVAIIIIPQGQQPIDNAGMRHKRK